MNLKVLNNSTPDIQVYNGDLEKDLLIIRLVKTALAIIHGWSSPGKMPSPGYSVPASKCITGAKLALIKGSVCFGCYAADSVEWIKRSGKNPYLGRYKMDNVKQALEKRFKSLINPLWVPAQVFLMRKRKLTYFRWHDAGDLQSVSHLRNIVLIALAVPGCKFWLPTREYKIVRQYLKEYGDFPANFMCRASAHMHNQDAPKDFPFRSAVDTGEYDYSDGAIKCGAYTRDGECGPCRKCWSKRAKTIVYPFH
tara:strand:- start:7162 stop:7917 length:756 start_codon:yes stop_codon:yes gene_type:complete